MKVYKESVLSIPFWIKICLTMGFYVFWWNAKELTIDVDGSRVKMRKGALSTDERTMLISQVTDVQIKQSLFGRILGYGTLHIQSAGGTAEKVIVFKNVAKPDNIRRMLIR